MEDGHGWPILLQFWISGVSRLLWPELGPGEAADGWLPDFPTVTTEQVLRALAARHPMDGWKGPGRWVFAREVNEATGLWGQGQRFDAVAIGLVPSVKYARVVYEVKVSRSDWLRELRPQAEIADRWGARRLSGKAAAAVLADPGQVPAWQVSESRKWDAALAVSTEFWVAAPPRCVQLGELPPEAGLIEVRPWGQAGALRARVVRQAPVRDTPIPDAGFWAAVLRRVATR